MDMKVLQFQNKKLAERIEQRKRAEEELHKRIEQLENRQRTDDAVLMIVNRYWNQVCWIYPRPPDKSVYLKIIFLISQPKHMLWVLKRTSRCDGSFEYPKHMFKLIGKKIITILC